MIMRNYCSIIGLLDDGVDGLTPRALDRLRSAHRVIGGARLLARIQPLLQDDQEIIDFSGHLTRTPDWVDESLRRGERVVVLATGDPLCHGIAGYLIRKIGQERCEVLPNVSTLQWAFARFGLPWQSAHVASIHGRDAGEWQPGAGPEHRLYPLLQACRTHDLIGLFTGPENSPDRVGRLLLAEEMEDEFRLYVAERLQQPEERLVGPLTPAEAAERDFAEPNVVLLQRTRQRPNPTLLGLPDDSYRQRKPDKGLITKREVRAVSLARLQLRRDSIVWDIGAGSGSVGLEAARLCPEGHVYAIEKNPADHDIATRNRQAMAVHNHTLRLGKAPEGLEQWPDPDAVFIGGSGGNLTTLIRLAMERLNPGGWLVMNFIALENLQQATDELKSLGAEWDLTQLQIARSRPILDMHRLQGENPVWILCATSKGILRDH